MSILNRRSTAIVAAATGALMLAPTAAMAADLPSVPAPDTNVPGAVVSAATVVSAAAVTATPMLFGNYNGNLGTDTVAQSRVVVLNTPGNTPVVSMDGGTSGDASHRTLANALGKPLKYQIYQDAAHTKVWGNSDGTKVTGNATDALQTFDAYGVIPKGQYATTGAYVDVVNVSVTY